MIDPNSHTLLRLASVDEGAHDSAAQLGWYKAKLAEAETRLVKAAQREQGVLQAAAPAMCFHVNADGKLLAYNGSDELLLAPREQVVGSHLTASALPPILSQELLQGVRRCIDSRTPQACHFELTLPVGVRQLEIRFAWLGGDEVIALVRDQTTEEQLSRAGRRALTDEHERILATLRDYVWSAAVDAEGQFHFRYCSPAVERLTGRPPAFYLAGRDNWRSTVHPDDLPAIEDDIAQAIRCDAAEVESVYRILLPSGEVRWMSDRVRCHPEGDELLITGVVSDVTEARMLNVRLRESQKLEALGVLAGGIAHDFNNILVGVLGGAETAAESLPPGHPAEAKLATIVESATRAAELCQQMLTYAGMASVSIQPTDVRSVVSGMAQLLGAAVSKQVRFQVDVPEGLPRVEADSPQLRQMLLSLVRNASEAAGQNAHAQVSLRAEQREMGAAELGESVVGRDAEPGCYVLLTVSDNGPGMDTRTQERMFEPFFTTKESGHGLGLAAALGIVRSHRGALQVTSTLGAGTQITVALPAAKGAPLEETAPSNPEPLGSASSGIVLLIDDEETVLFIASTILEGEGYRVQTANNGRRGIDLFSELHREVQLVVLDMTMPGLSGSDVYHELRAIDPDVPVLLSSGYSEQDALGELTQQDKVAFLHKPYRAAELRDAVSQTSRALGSQLPD